MNYFKDGTFWSLPKYNCFVILICDEGNHDDQNTSFNNRLYTQGVKNDHQNILKC